MVLTDRSCGDEDHIWEEPYFPRVLLKIPTSLLPFSVTGLGRLTGTYSLSTTATIQMALEHMVLSTELGYGSATWSLACSLVLPGTIERPWRTRHTFDLDVGNLLHCKVAIKTQTTEHTSKAKATQ